MKTVHRVLLLLLLPTLTVIAQDRKPLDHSVYDIWKHISGESISPDGKWAAYTVEPGEGDAVLVLLNLATGKADTIQRGTGCRFSDDSRYAAFLVRPFFAETRKAKIAKKSADDLPKDTLGILPLGTFPPVFVPRVKSFLFPRKGGGWIAYQLDKPLAAQSGNATQKKDAPAQDAAGSEKSKAPEKGSTVVLRDLSRETDWQFPLADEYAFAKNGGRFGVTCTGGDSTGVAGVFSVDLQSRVRDTLAIGKGIYKQLALDEEGKQVAFLADRDTSRSPLRSFGLYHWAGGKDSALLIADTVTPGMKKKWIISENGDLWFSRNGKRLFFGTSPRPVPDDTTFNDEVTAGLDIWNWEDAVLQPEQLKNADREKKRTYLAMYHLEKSRLVQLGDIDLPEVVAGDEGNADVVLAQSDLPYRRAQSWLGKLCYDVTTVDMVSGLRVKILTKAQNGVSLSPGGKYVTMYDYATRQWRAINLLTLRAVDVTQGIKVPLYDELFDQPDEPGPYGVLGWTEGDQRLLVYDRFDIWETDPSGKLPPVNLTAGAGRASHTRYRFVQLDPEARFLPSQGTLFLRVFNETDKRSGFALAKIGTPGIPRALNLTPHAYGTPIKAKYDSTLLLTRETFSDFPDLYVADFGLQHLRRISDANPQQREYLWGSVELISWKPSDGKPLQGLLYKPALFDPKKKYPMIVYYYERLSDGLYRHYLPAPSRSTVSPSIYTSQGYVVFMPDIRYTTGHPGKSALEVIVTGTKAVLARGFVDKDRIGLQGQSWGGYQTAYVVTQTSMFRAAMAGAPVANMTSAYGGIRWESGWSREWQYEKSQSRIGATLWEKPALYIENSPLFHAPAITTPLLIMSNDADGAVPWYQGIEFFTALRRLGKPAWLLVYNNEEHNLTKWKNRKDLSQRMSQFFDHYLKGTQAPVWMTRGRPAVDKNKTMALEPASGK
jgi:dienelactone hydrolase